MDSVGHDFPESVYQLRQTLFDELVSFNIPHSDDQKFFKNMAIFDFKSICVQEDKFHETKTTTWISTHAPLSLSISSNLIEKPMFLCDCNPAALIRSFVDARNGLATQKEGQMK